MREIVDAVKTAVPDAANRPAGEVLEYVRSRLIDTCIEQPIYGQLIWAGTQNIEVFGSPGINAEYRKLDSRRTGGGDVRGFTAA